MKGHLPWNLSVGDQVQQRRGAEAYSGRRKDIHCLPSHMRATGERNERKLWSGTMGRVCCPLRVDESYQTAKVFPYYITLQVYVLDTILYYISTTSGIRVVRR